jgi:hypothetical protein
MCPLGCRTRQQRTVELVMRLLGEMPFDFFLMYKSRLKKSFFCKENRMHQPLPAAALDSISLSAQKDIQSNAFQFDNEYL